MATITVDIPDELMPQFSQVQDNLPQLLLALTGLTEEVGSHQSMGESAVLDEMLDFLTSAPTPQEIINYKVSTAVQQRLETLLDKNREALLNPREQAELISYQQLNHLFILLKARSRTLPHQPL